MEGKAFNLQKIIDKNKWPTASARLNGKIVRSFSKELGRKQEASNTTSIWYHVYGHTTQNMPDLVYLISYWSPMPEKSGVCVCVCMCVYVCVCVCVCVW
jgi:hypothetical protein